MRKIETNDAGRVTGVLYFDKDKKEVVQHAKAVVLCRERRRVATAAADVEVQPRFHEGLANSSGMVGKHFMFNGAATSRAEFEHEINGFKGPVVSRISHHTYELDPSLGFIGGGGFDFRFDVPALIMALSLPHDRAAVGQRLQGSGCGRGTRIRCSLWPHDFAAGRDQQRFTRPRAEGRVGDCRRCARRIRSTSTTCGMYKLVPGARQRAARAAAGALRIPR